MHIDELYSDALNLLRQLISTPSFSRQEDVTAALIENFLRSKGIVANRHLNNVWAVNKFYDKSKPSILLNSHHDTVKPNHQYTKDPFTPVIEDDKLYGLGSNDAGGCLVSLMAAFVYFCDKENLKYNIVIGATSEEEISGFNGIEALLNNEDFILGTSGAFKHSPALGDSFAIVGEPTQLNLAIAEKGLMVLDCLAHGKAGHAAREEGDNAIYKAIKDITWINSYQFPKVSEWLGNVKMNVTVINTENKAHNVVPSQCAFVVDVRVTDAYSHEDVLDIIQENVSSEIRPRSLRMRSTRIGEDHPVIQAGIESGKTVYGSPTCSDKALMPFPALKCGPGNSARSHTADEYIFLQEIKEGIAFYIQLISKLV